MMYGIGSCYNSNEEMMGDFISRSVASIGWSTDNQAIHGLFDQVTTGDIVFLKSFPAAHGLYIKAIGIVSNYRKWVDPQLGNCVEVRWLWSAKSNGEYIKLGRLNDKCDNLRSGSVFPEFSPVVLKSILDKIAG